MILAKKVRLYPTQKQEEILWKSVGTARFIYNWTLAKQEENYKSGGKFLSDGVLRKELTQLKKTEFSWLNEVSNNVSKQAVKDLAVCSDGTVYKNINKTYVVRKIEKRLKRLQKQVSRKYEQNKKGKEYVKTKNIIKLEKKIQQIHRRLANIRTNYLHQTTTRIVKTKPYRVVVEDLNVKGMMKNKHLSDAIRKQGFYEFKRQLEYKCKLRGIEFVVADRFYPSSKICSQCGKIKKDLKLKDRVYQCSCGLMIDRDFNASMNLSNYKLA